MGDTQKHPVYRARYRHGHPLVPFGKKRQDLQTDVVSGHTQLFVLHPGSFVLTDNAYDRDADAAENMYVYLDDSNVFEGKKFRKH